MGVTGGGGVEVEDEGGGEDGEGGVEEGLGDVGC